VLAYHLKEEIRISKFEARNKRQSHISKTEKEEDLKILFGLFEFWTLGP
jgi:hypothetical protein